MNLPNPQQLDVDYILHGQPNFQRWMELTAGQFSPTSYKILGWLSCVSSAAQRRYRFGCPGQQYIVPNTYTILVGASGAGKGLILRAVKDILSTPKRKKNSVEKDLIIAGPDDTTYEALVDSLCRAINITDSEPPQAYMSMYLCLGEVESMFKKHAERLSLFLISCWDADKYDYATKGSGSYSLKNLSATILAGGVTKYVKELTTSRLMTDGFVGRTMFVFDSSPSSTEFFMPPLTPDQLSKKNLLIEQVRHIATRSGEFTMPDDVKDLLTAYWKERVQPKAADEKELLNAFYARYREHIPKLAMCLQLSDSGQKILSRDSVMKATHIIEHVTYLMNKEFSKMIAENSQRNVSSGQQPSQPAKTQQSPELANTILSELAKVNSAGLSWIQLYQIFTKQKVRPTVVQEAVHALARAGQVTISGVRVHSAAPHQ